jgi:hypothetical protein
MSESHCPVVKMVGVQDKLLRSPRSIAKSSCTSRSLGEVASSSNGQQAREQKRSAWRQESHFVVENYWKELPAQRAYDLMMHKANGSCPSEIIEPPSPCGSEGDPCEFEEIPHGFSRWVNRKEADNKGWEGELPQPRRTWRCGLRLRPARLALCDSDGDSGAEDDGGGGGSDSGTEDDEAGGGNATDDAVDTSPAG